MAVTDAAACGFYRRVWNFLPPELHPELVSTDAAPGIVKLSSGGGAEIATAVNTVGVEPEFHRLSHSVHVTQIQLMEDVGEVV